MATTAERCYAILNKSKKKVMTTRELAESISRREKTVGTKVLDTLLKADSRFNKAEQGKWKLVQLTKFQKKLADSAYQIMKEKKQPMTEIVLYRQLIVKGIMGYDDVEKFRRTLQIDKRFRPWGKSSKYWVLVSMKEFSRPICDFYRDIINDLLEYYGDFLNFESIMEGVSKQVGFSVNPQYIRMVLQEPEGEFVNIGEDLYAPVKWGIEAVTRTKVPGLTEVIFQIIERKKRFMTLKEICQELKKNGIKNQPHAVSGILSGDPKKRFCQIGEIFWALRKWKSNEIKEMKEKYLEKNIDFILTEAEIRNGTLRLTREQVFAFSAGPDNLRLQDGEKVYQIHLNRQYKYLFGLGTLFRIRGVKAKARVTLSPIDIKEGKYGIRLLPGRSSPIVHPWFDRLGRTPFASFVSHYRRPTWKTIYPILNKHTKPGDLVFYPYDADPSLTLGVLAMGRRIIVRAEGELEKLFFNSQAIVLDRWEELEKEILQIMEEWEPEFGSYYRLEGCCPRCGGPLISERIEMVNVSNMVVPTCLNEDCAFKEKRGERERRREMSVKEMNWLGKLDRKVEGVSGYPETEVPETMRYGWGMRYLKEAFTPRNFLVLTLLNERIKAIKNTEIRNILRCSFLEILPGLSSFHLSYDRWEKNVWLYFRRRVKRYLHNQRKIVESKDREFLPKLGTPVEVLKPHTKSNLALLDSYNDLPSECVDYILTYAPFHRIGQIDRDVFLKSAWLGVPYQIEKELDYDTCRKKAREFIQVMHRTLKADSTMSLVYTLGTRPKEILLLNQACEQAGFQMQDIIEGIYWGDIREAAVINYRKKKAK